MLCNAKDSAGSTPSTKSIKPTPLERVAAPVGSGRNLAQALALAAEAGVDGNSEIWVRSGDQPLDPQMSAIVAIGSSLIDELNSNWHLACLACNAAELEVELWG